MKRGTLFAGFLATVMVSAAASAQDLAAADALFEKGIADMEAGNFASGCPALAESYRVAPRPGTLFALAECENQAGRIATAVARYDEYLRLFARMAPDQQEKQKARAQESEAQKARIAPDVPQLTITLPPGAPRDVTVKRDDLVLGAASLGLALPVDPGEHVITSQVGAGAAREQRFTIARGEKRTLVVELSSGAAGEPQRLAGASPAGAPVATTGGDAGPTPAKGNTQRTAAFVVGGVGAVGIVVGAITGGLAMGKTGAIEEKCPDRICSQEGKDTVDSAQLLGNVSTVAFIVGGVGLAAGAVLFATAPRRTSLSLAPRRAARGPTFDVVAAPSGAIASARGRW